MLCASLGVGGQAARDTSVSPARAGCTAGIQGDFLNEKVDGRLPAPSGVSLPLASQPVSTPRTPPHEPKFLPDLPQDGSSTGEKEICTPAPLGAYQRAPVSALPLSPATGHRGPVALVSEVFEQHLGGHILQVRPLPCLLLLAATWWPPAGSSTLFSSTRPMGAWGGGPPRSCLPFPTATEPPSPIHPS